jgi:hypothetical protein
MFMILRIYLVVANTIIGWFWVCRNKCSKQQQRESSGYAQLLLIVPLNQIDTTSGLKLSKNPRPITVLFLWFKQWILLLGAPRRPCGVQPTVLDALICSFWKRANIIWMTIQLCGVHCHCFIHKAHNQAHWECANKYEGASKCVHDL